MGNSCKKVCQDCFTPEQQRDDNGIGQNKSNGSPHSKQKQNYQSRPALYEESLNRQPKGVNQQKNRSPQPVHMPPSVNQKQSERQRQQEWNRQQKVNNSLITAYNILKEKLTLSAEFRVLEQRKKHESDRKRQIEKQIQDKRRLVDAMKKQLQQLEKQLALARHKLEAENNNSNITSNYPQNPDQINTQIQALTQKIDASRFNIQQNDAKIQRLKDQLKQIESTINQLNSQIQELQRNIEKLNFDISKINAQVDSIRSTTQQAVQETRQIKERRKENLVQIGKTKDEISELQNLFRKLTGQPPPKPQYQQSDENRYIQLFAGVVLEGEDDYKQFLTDILQRRTHNSIVGTKLIYSYDPLNKVNFHKYIDAKTQIVVLVKLKNGYTLGGWSEGSFQPKMVSDKDGLIFSLTNRKTFEPLERNRRAIAYDDFFLIFGNSQIRLKSQDTKVFSNFGISNGYYNTRGERVDILLGSGSVREVEMEYLEVFQLIFK